jgi:hypothetical protein
MNIHHSPITDIDAVIKHYTEKDGVPVKYVCTSGRGQSVEFGDIFYRNTPHPEFGNKYFILTYRDCNVLIGNADWIESEEFGMVEWEGTHYYSRGRHDHITKGDVMIDGGRAYIRNSGYVEVFKVKDGEFYNGN